MQNEGVNEMDKITGSMEVLNSMQITASQRGFSGHNKRIH